MLSGQMLDTRQQTQNRYHTTYTHSIIILKFVFRIEINRNIKQVLLRHTFFYLELWFFY